MNIYRTTHTYPGPGAYTIGVQIQNRNADTKNLPPAAQSSTIVFYVSTTISIDQNLGLNRSPVMLNPPLDSARVGQRFTHNPAAYDADGDSLAYRRRVYPSVAFARAGLFRFIRTRPASAERAKRAERQRSRSTPEPAN